MNKNRTIIFDTRWIGTHGIGRFAAEVHKCNINFRAVNIDSKPADPLDPFILTKYLLRNAKNELFYSPGYNFPLLNLKRTIITIHDLNHIDVSYNSSFLKRIYYNQVLKRICHQIPVILTVSEFTKNRIVSWSGIDPEKVHNVGNGVSSAFNNNVLPYIAKRPYYLIVGNRKKHKNEMLSLQAYKEIGDDNYDLYFTGDTSDEIDTFIKNNGLEDRVFFKSAKEDSELAALYKGAHCLLFPSHYEGFGLPVIEAMACGTPVITSTTSSLPEVSGGAALLVNPDSVSEMKNAMNLLKSDSTIREELIRKGLIVSQKYNWDSVRKKVENILSKI